MDTGIVNNTQPNIQKKSHTPFIILLGAFLALIFLRAVVGVSFPASILLGWVAIMALSADRDEIIALIFVCLPTSAAFQYKYGLFICMVVYILKYKDDMRINLWGIVPVLCMMVWDLAHGLFYDLVLKDFANDFALFILLAFLMCIKTRKVDFDFICHVLGYTIFVIGLFVLFNVLKSNNYDLNALFESGKYRFGVGNEEATQFGLNYNPNALGSLCNCGIIVLMITRYMKRNKAFDYVVIIGLILIGGLTVSRSFILTCATVFLFFSLLGNKSGKGRVKMLFTTAFLVLIVWYVVSNFIPSVYDSFIERFSVDDISNGRGDLMDFYGEHIYSSWEYSLFGIGLQDTMSKLNQIYGYVMAVPHNAIQEILVIWGYPGLIMMIALIISMIHSARQGVKKFNIVNFIPLIFVLATAMAGQLITIGYKFLMLSFAYITLSNDFSKEEEKNE